jgi:hypothetical protein
MMMNGATAIAIAICWGLPALAYVYGADALRSVRSFALSLVCVRFAATIMQALIGGSLSTWLTGVAVLYAIGLIGAHMTAMYFAKHHSGQAGLTGAAIDSLRMRRAPNRTTRIKDRGYYNYYNGHEVLDLRYAHQKLRELGCNSFIFLCGDSSFDNKHWFFSKARQSTSNATRTTDSIQENEMRDDAITASAVNGYEEVLISSSNQRTAPRMAKDVCYWLNLHAAGDRDVCTIMSAVEASTAADRCEHQLLTQDEFIRDTLTEDDYVLMSVCGNDIAMAPTLATIVNIGLLCYSPFWLIWLGLAPGYAHIVRWLGSMLTKYVGQLTEKTKPRKVVVCMIYYPDVTPAGGWADGTLGLLLYRRWAAPGMLQFVIRTLYRTLAAALERERRPGGALEGLEVVPFPLFEVLDGQTSADYNQRVEPSVQGGEKMAKALLAELGLGKAEQAAGGGSDRPPARQSASRAHGRAGRSPEGRRRR